MYLAWFEIGGKSQRALAGSPLLGKALAETTEKSRQMPIILS